MSCRTILNILAKKLNSYVQFCPFPVYPAWHSHTYDPRVFTHVAFTWQETQDEIARICKRKRGRNMLNRFGNTTDNLCFRYRFRDVFSRFRCCVNNGTGPLFVHVKHNGNMELHVSATFQKYGNMWFRPVKDFLYTRQYLRNRKCILHFFFVA